MKVLVDTHIALWAVFDVPLLPQAATLMIRSPDNEIFVSAVSLWEIAIKAAVGKIGITATQALAAFEAAQYRTLEVSKLHCRSLDALPLNGAHKDPFDRMLVAQALAEGMTFLTADRKMEGYHPVLIRIV